MKFLSTPKGVKITCIFYNQTQQSSKECNVTIKYGNGSLRFYSGIRTDLSHSLEIPESLELIDQITKYYFSATASTTIGSSKKTVVVEGSLKLLERGTKGREGGKR